MVVHPQGLSFDRRGWEQPPLRKALWPAPQPGLQLARLQPAVDAVIPGFSHRLRVHCTAGSALHWRWRRTGHMERRNLRSARDSWATWRAVRTCALTAARTVRDRVRWTVPVGPRATRGSAPVRPRVG